MSENDDITENNEEDEESELVLTDEANEESIKKPSSKLTQRSLFYSQKANIEKASAETIAVVGSGTVGGLITGLFMREGNNKVLCFSSPSSSKRIVAEGMSVNSKVYGDFSFRPEIVHLVKERPKIIVVATRATHVDIAMTSIYKKRVEGSIIIAITSGFEYLKNLRNDYGYSLSVGFIEPFCAYREDVNRIIHEEKKLKLLVANDKTIERDRLEAVADKFSMVGIDFKIMNSVVDLVWLKMTSFCAISLISGAAREPFKRAIKNKKWADSMEKIIAESLNIAKKEGSKITYDSVMKIINDVPNSYKPPLLLDLEKGQIGEIDAIAGSIARLENRYETNCLEIKTLINDIISTAPKYYEVKTSPFV